MSNFLKKVVTGKISNSLYATKENVEPNIIIEFAEFLVSVDFQRDIRKE